MSDELILIISYVSWFLFSVIASLHLLLNRYEAQPALGWLGLIWLAPFSGFFLYLLFGIRRVRRKGALLSSQFKASEIESDKISIWKDSFQKPKLTDLSSSISQAKLLLDSWKIVQAPVLSLSSMRIFDDGDSAYGNMIEAINQASKVIFFQSYIFDSGVIGNMFLESLEKAKLRGVRVYVLIDAIGARYSSHSMAKKLKSKGICTRLFLQPFYPKHISFLNLRNHRKILIIDNYLVYTGGMNIRDSHSKRFASTGTYTRDLHFSFEGELAIHLARIFQKDWQLAKQHRTSANEILNLVLNFPKKRKKNSGKGRIITDGPDEKQPKTLWLLLLAINAAKESIEIITPYFLPDSKLLDALILASLRGVEVAIVVPRKGNISLVNWAMYPQFYSLLENNCRIYLSPPPFDHSKLIVIDRSWAMIGSSNWDMRSLALNFELNLEIYEKAWVGRLSELCAKKIAQSSRLKLDELHSIGFWQRVRNHASMLLSPYL